MQYFVHLSRIEVINNLCKSRAKNIMQFCDSNFLSCYFKRNRFKFWTTMNYNFVILMAVKWTTTHVYTMLWFSFTIGTNIWCFPLFYIRYHIIIYYHTYTRTKENTKLYQGQNWTTACTFATNNMHFHLFWFKNFLFLPQSCFWVCIILCN